MTRKEFDSQFKKSLDSMVEKMAGNPEIDVKDFYGLVYYFENLAFFSPVLYGLLDKNEEGNDWRL